MTLVETGLLLAFIARITGRKEPFDTIDAQAWHDVLGHLPAADVMAAARNHFRNSDEFLKPVHIAWGAAQIERSRREAARLAIERSERLAIEADPTRRDRSEETRALIAGLRDTLPEGDPDKLRRSEWVELDRRRDRERRAEPNPHYDPRALLAAQDA